MAIDPVLLRHPVVGKDDLITREWARQQNQLQTATVNNTQSISNIQVGSAFDDGTARPRDVQQQLDDLRALLAASDPPVPPGTGGSGTAVATGSATIDFGAAPGTNQVSVAVTGQTAILSSSTISAFLMYDSTASHNAEEHLVAPINLRAGSIVAGAGFTIYAMTEWRLSGTFTVRWIWS